MDMEVDNESFSETEDKRQKLMEVLGHPQKEPLMEWIQRDPEGLNDLSCDYLRLILTQLGLKKSGRKRDLIERILGRELPKSPPVKGEGYGGTLGCPYRRRVPKVLQEEVWQTYIGGNRSRAKCLLCNSRKITVFNFDCGHVHPYSKGGPTILANLRPICHKCNQSMGTTHMKEFAQQYYPSAPVLGTFMEDFVSPLTFPSTLPPVQFPIVPVINILPYNALQIWGHSYYFYPVNWSGVNP